MASTQALKKSIEIRNLFDAPNRRYVFTQEVADSCQKSFHFVQSDLKLLRFAQDELGAVSDCHVLYAVAMLASSEAEAVRLFLNALSVHNKDLAISDMTGREILRSRLKALFNGGLLFRHQYEVPNLYDEEAGTYSSALVTLYTVTGGAQAMVNQKLEKHLQMNEWVQAKQIGELIGWASCAYVLGMLSANAAYKEVRQGLIKTPAVGQAFHPGYLITNTGGDQDYHVGVFRAFLHRNKASQTDEDFEKACFYQVTLIKQFFFMQDKKSHYARAVVVVEDNADLVHMAEWILQSGALSGDLDRVYFTGEGAVRTIGRNLSDCFLQMEDTRDNPKSRMDYNFLAVKPDFLVQ